MKQKKQSVQEIVSLSAVQEQPDVASTVIIEPIVMFQKWRLGASDAELVNWKAADFCKDNKLNIFDLTLMRRELICNQ